MKFTLSWLKKYLDTNATVEEIEDKLTFIGLEIEEVVNPVDSLQDFVIGEVVSVEKHPDADKLNLLKVFDGKEELQIVCGAPNCKVGMKGVLAKVGTLIPLFNERLKKGNIRGLDSVGMMCAEDELKVGSDHNGIIEIPSSIDCKAGDKASDVLAKMYSLDVIFDGEITPNRADYLGVRGIAVDLAGAGLGQYIKQNDIVLKEEFENPISVKIEDEQECPLFMTAYIRGVKNTESSNEIKTYLNSIGAGVISAAVDATNFVLFDMARPTHVFDADKIKGNLVVKKAAGGEKFVGLDEIEYVLNAGDIVICDDTGVVSLAGIMGGLSTAVDMDTKNILVESALFNPIQIRKTAAQLKINTDAKYRFERFVAPETTLEGLKKVVDIIVKSCGGSISKINSVGKMPESRFGIDYPVDMFKKVIGIDCSKETMIDILKNLQFDVEDKGDILSLLSPSHRGDIQNDYDITEEIIRIYGYDKIPFKSILKKDVQRQQLSLYDKTVLDTKKMLVGRGFDELITYEFIKQKDVEVFGGNADLRISNPISVDMDILRQSLLPCLVNSVKSAMDRGLKDLSVFETGVVYEGVVPDAQSDNIAGVRQGLNIEKSWNGRSREFDVYDIKADMLSVLKIFGIKETSVRVSQDEKDLPVWAHTYQGASVFLGNKKIAEFGQIHPSIVLNDFGIKRTKLFAFEIFVKQLPALKARKNKDFVVASLNPVKKDLSFIVDEDVAAGLIVDAVYRSDKKHISYVNVFDVYYGEALNGKKSVALTVTLEQLEKTLTDKEIGDIIKLISEKVKKSCGGELRDS